jgi:hypothetical protein
MVGATGGFSVMVAAEETDASAMLVAVKVTVATELMDEGAVYVTPFVEDALSVPAPVPMLQITPAFDESLATLAAKTCTPLPLSDAVVGVMATLIAGGGLFDGELLLPQPARRANNVHEHTLTSR